MCYGTVLVIESFLGQVSLARKFVSDFTGFFSSYETSAFLLLLH